MPCEPYRYSVWKGQQEIKFVSSFTTAEAIELVRPLTDGNDFLRDIVSRWDQSHVMGSLKVAGWLHYYAVQQHEKISKPPEERRPAFEEIAVPGARVLFDKAKQSGLKLPAIFLILGDGPSGLGVKLKLAPMHGKNPNCVYVTCEEKYHGKITPQGVYLPCNEQPPGLIDLLRQLSDDPVGTAKRYGKITNRCCFCRLELSNLASIYNGFGPVCAEKYGLPREEPPPGWNPVEQLESTLPQAAAESASGE